MTHPLQGARAKIERAKEHCRDSASVAMAFLNERPYTIAAHYDAQAQQQVYGTVVNRQPADRLAAIIGDAVHNLESALDYLAYELVRLNGGTLTNKIYFPVCWDRKQYITAFLRKVEGMSDPAIALIDSMQPYHKAPDFLNDPLYVLHDLDVRDKHQSLHVVGSAEMGHFVEIGVPTDSYYLKIDTTASSSAWVSPIQDGTELFRLPPGYGQLFRSNSVTQADVKAHVTFGVVIQEVRPGVDEPIGPLLAQLTQFVEGTLDTFERTFFV